MLNNVATFHDRRRPLTGLRSRDSGIRSIADVLAELLAQYGCWPPENRPAIRRVDPEIRMYASTTVRNRAQRRSGAERQNGIVRAVNGLPDQ